MARDFAKQFYRSPEWERMRSYILIRDKYKCRKCGCADALEVHHITHLTPSNINDSSITLNDRNLITLCRNCHFETHKADRLAAHLPGSSDCDDDMMFDENGFLIPKGEGH